MDVFLGCIKGRRPSSFEGYEECGTEGVWVDVGDSWQELTLNDGGSSNKANNNNNSKRDAHQKDQRGSKGGSSSSLEPVIEASNNGAGGGSPSPPPPPPPPSVSVTASKSSSLLERLSSSTKSSKQRRKNTPSSRKHGSGGGYSSGGRSGGAGSGGSGSSLFSIRRLSSASTQSSPAGSSHNSSTSSRPVCFVAPFTPDAPSNRRTTPPQSALALKSAAGDSPFLPTPLSLTPPVAVVSPVTPGASASTSPKTRITTAPKEIIAASLQMAPLLHEGLMMTPPTTPASNGLYLKEFGLKLANGENGKTTSFDYLLHSPAANPMSTTTKSVAPDGDAPQMIAPLLLSGPPDASRKKELNQSARGTAHNNNSNDRNNPSSNFVALTPPKPSRPGVAIDGLIQNGASHIISNVDPTAHQRQQHQRQQQWLPSFPVTTFVSLPMDQEIVAIDSSPQVKSSGEGKKHEEDGSSGKDNGGGKGPPPISHLTKELQLDRHHHPHQIQLSYPSPYPRPAVGHNLHLIVARYQQMSRERVDQRFSQHKLQLQQPNHHSQNSQAFSKGRMQASSKFLPDSFGKLTLSSAAPKYSPATGVGRLPVRSDEEAFASFTFLAVLGKGNFGKVILCRDKLRQDKRLCAIKVLKKKEIVKKREVVHTMTEVEVLRTLHHPFLVECYAAFQTASRLCLVLEYVVGGEVYYQLFKRRRFSEEMTKFYVSEIVLAVGFLHANDFIYRDLKLENLLLDATGHIKITDFGLCKDLRAWKNDQLLASANGDRNDRASTSTSSSADRRRFTSRRDMTFCGTPEYLAPEMLHVPGSFNGVTRGLGGGGPGVGPLIYGQGVDWWALGIIIYEMLLGKLPFRTKTGDYDQLFHCICHRDIHLPDSLVGDVRALLDGLLQRNPLLRLGHSHGNGRDYLDICESPWFNDVDWDAVYQKKIAPPFIPRVDREDDTQHFSRDFLEMPTELTPTTSFVAQSPSQRRPQDGANGSGKHHPEDPFRGFSFTRNY